MNEVENEDLGVEFLNSAVEFEPKPADEPRDNKEDVVIGSLLFDRDGYVPTQRRPRVRSSSIL